MRWILTTALLFIALPSSASERRFHEDANLRAVQFLNAQEGWVVGDDGVILHTIDSGRTWERRPTGSRASLRSVHFINTLIGWVVGREELPSGSVGVMLYTRDGGETWKQILPDALPGLNVVRFLDPMTGFVMGDGCDQYPSGVFKTIDGGRTWEPVAGPRTTSWLTGDFQDNKMGVLAGAWSKLATFKQDQFFSGGDVETLSGRHITGLQFMPKRLLAVAQGGLVLSSASAGARWGFVDLKLPTEVLANLDFHALHSVGNRVWIVGRPGSFVLASDDAGSTWTMNKTGQSLPLTAVFFFDADRGWAVGAAGTILATTDAGKTWIRQRQPITRSAAIIIQARDRSLPADTLAQLGAAEGYLVSALRVAAADPLSAAPARSSESLRYDSAVRSSGGLMGETMWNFALPQYLETSDKQQILTHWGKSQGGHAERELVRQLVLALRIWQPSAIIGDHPDGKMPLDSLVAEAWQEAIQRANDPQEFPEQIELGLKTCRVNRAFGIWDKAEEGVVQNNQQPFVELKASLREYAMPAAHLLTGDINQIPSERCFRQVHGNASGKHLMLGLVCEPGESRRTLAAVEPDAELIKSIRARQQLISLPETLDDPTKALAQLVPHLAKLPEDRAPIIAFSAASTFARRGQWQAARETFSMMVERYPAHPLSAEANRWLIRYGSSSELRRRQELKHFVAKSKTTIVQTIPTTVPEKDEIVQASTIASPKTDSQLTVLSNKNEAQAGYRQSLESGKRLAAFGSIQVSDPATQFSLQVARRGLNETQAAQEFHGRFQKFVAQGPWSEASRAELWLATRVGASPRRVAPCRLTEARPYLDAKFDDPCWQGQKPILLDNASGDSANAYRTQAIFSYDQEFLYIALHCQHPKGETVAPVRPRSHDADLEGQDRISILIDLDRDYSTFYRLEVDQRGCVCEDCCGDVSWNPRWFVAVKDEDDCWRVEAAIPLSELTGDRIALGNAWAFNVVRTLPGRGVQSISLPADVRPRPEGLGLLLFQQDAARTQLAPMPTTKEP